MKAKLIHGLIIGLFGGMGVYICLSIWPEIGAVGTILSAFVFALLGAILVKFFFKNGVN